MATIRKLPPRTFDTSKIFGVELCNPAVEHLAVGVAAEKFNGSIYVGGATQC